MGAERPLVSPLAREARRFESLSRRTRPDRRLDSGRRRGRRLVSPPKASDHKAESCSGRGSHDCPKDIDKNRRCVPPEERFVRARERAGSTKDAVRLMAEREHEREGGAEKPEDRDEHPIPRERGGQALLLACTSETDVAPTVEETNDPEHKEEGCDREADPQWNPGVDLCVRRHVRASSAPVAPLLVRVAPLTKPIDTAIAVTTVRHKNRNGEAHNKHRAHGETPCAHECESRFLTSPGRNDKDLRSDVKHVTARG